MVPSLWTTPSLAVTISFHRIPLPRYCSASDHKVWSGSSTVTVGPLTAGEAAFCVGLTCSGPVVAWGRCRLAAWAGAAVAASAVVAGSSSTMLPTRVAARR